MVDAVYCLSMFMGREWRMDQPTLPFLFIDFFKLLSACIEHIQLYKQTPPPIHFQEMKINKWQIKRYKNVSSFAILQFLKH